MQRPERLGNNVRASGVFPSDLSIPWGSLTEGIPAWVRLFQIRSFRTACWAYLPGHKRDNRPCELSAVIRVPHKQSCGWQMTASRRRPPLSELPLHNLRPHVLVGRANLLVTSVWCWDCFQTCLMVLTGVKVIKLPLQWQICPKKTVCEKALRLDERQGI